MKKKYILSGIIIFFIVLGIFYFYENEEKKVNAGVGSGIYDLIGTRVGTTTTGGGFYKTAANNGTSSAITYISSYIDEAIFSFKVTAASSTPNGKLHYAVFGSNDGTCNTATTTTVLADTIVTKDINWYTLGSSAEGQVTATASATGTVLSLKNLTYRCLKLEANGSSTEALIQLITKDIQ